MAWLVECSRCRRHIKIAESACPHCGADRTVSVARASMLAVGLTLAACGTKDDGAGGSESETTQDGTTGIGDGPLDWMEGDAYGVADTGYDDFTDDGPVNMTSTSENTGTGVDDTSTGTGSDTDGTDTGATDTTTAGTTETGDSTADTSATQSSGESGEPTGTGPQDGG